MRHLNSTFFIKVLKWPCLGLLLIFFTHCKVDKTKPNYKVSNDSIKYAKGFDIQVFENYKILRIINPYPGAKEPQEFVLTTKNANYTSTEKGQIILQVPLQKLAVTSTTHIPMLERLNGEQKLVGFPNTQYISSVKTRKRIENGFVVDIGKEDGLNTEIILGLQPEAIIGFSMSANNKMFSALENAGIPVLLNGDWLEETPLGRAEWIKFFGVLLGQEELANKVFNEIRLGYEEAKLIALKANERPTVMSGVQFKEVWNLPGGESFVAQFLKDANSDYLWADTKGKGSLSLNFESVLVTANAAEFWIAPGHYTSFQQLEHNNDKYKAFEAFKNQNVYTFTIKKGENGGALYYEHAALEPHHVLKDLIKLFHPNLLPDYKFHFLDRLLP